MDSTVITARRDDAREYPGRITGAGIVRAQLTSKPHQSGAARMPERWVPARHHNWQAPTAHHGQRAFDPDALPPLSTAAAAARQAMTMKVKPRW